MRSCCWRTPTDQARLFKPFGQLKSGRKQGGTGLGLAISYRLVKALILSTAKPATPIILTCRRKVLK